MASPCPCGNLDEPYYKWVDTSNGENGYYFIVEALYPEQHLKSIPEAKAVPVAQKMHVPPVIPSTILTSITTVVPSTTVASTIKPPPVPPPMPSPLVATELLSPSTNTATTGLTESPAQLQMEDSVLSPPSTSTTNLGLGEALARFAQGGGKLRSQSNSTSIMSKDKSVVSSSESFKGSNTKSMGEKPALMPKPNLQQVLLSRSQVFNKSTDEDDDEDSDWDY